MTKVTCDYCKGEIKSNKEFIAVTQFYPKFPYSKFHTSCYSEFLKNRFWVITPRDGAGVISGKNGTRGSIIATFMMIFIPIFFFFVIYPKIPNAYLISIIALLFFLMGLIYLLVSIFLRIYIHYKYEKNLK